jgi:isopenicillin-N N-acyltransferase-like protein
MRAFLAFSVLVCSACTTFATEPASVFKPGKYGKGELKFVEGVPVLIAAGKPAEIGEQIGALVGKNSPDPRPVLDEFLKAIKLENGFDALKLVARNLKPNLPADHRTEMEAISKASGYDPDLLWFANTVYDLSSGMGCATVLVESPRSKTGAPIFGRNFDWVASKGLPQQAIVFVLKPEGKYTFASVTLSPITGLISGMNEHGLSCTINEITLSQSKDKAKFNWDGVPTLLAFRRVLEECKTVAEAEKLLRGMKRTTSASLSICDTKGGAVFEITPKAIEVRTPTNDVTLCTNHFTSAELGIAPKKECWRLAKLLKTQRYDGKLGVDDVFAELDAVSQKGQTLQCMVFEPAKATLHLKLGDGKTSATKAKPSVIDLAKLWK